MRCLRSAHSVKFISSEMRSKMENRGTAKMLACFGNCENAQHFHVFHIVRYTRWYTQPHRCQRLLANIYTCLYMYMFSATTSEQLSLSLLSDVARWIGREQRFDVFQMYILREQWSQSIMKPTSTCTPSFDFTHSSQSHWLRQHKCFCHTKYTLTNSHTHTHTHISCLV